MPGYFRVIIGIVGAIFSIVLVTLMLGLVQFAQDNSHTMWVIVIMLFSTGLCVNQIRRHGIVVSALAVVALLLSLKYASTMYGIDSTYIDTALKFALEVPRMIVEDLLPWINEGLSVFFWFSFLSKVTPSTQAREEGVFSLLNLSILFCFEIAEPIDTNILKW